MSPQNGQMVQVDLDYTFAGGKRESGKIEETNGTAAATTRGFNQQDFEKVGNMIADTLDSLLLEENERNEIFNKTRKDIIELYPDLKELLSNDVFCIKSQIFLKGVN